MAKPYAIKGMLLQHLSIATQYVKHANVCRLLHTMTTAMYCVNVLNCSDIADNTFSAVEGMCSSVSYDSRSNVQGS